MRGWRLRACAIALILAVTPWLSGCSNLSYYWQAASGHLRLMNAARPVSDWLADPATPDPLKERLALTQRIRDYAVRELHLPDNTSYRRYADLRRAAAVWNVVAAPEDSLTLRTSCFLFTGCIGYRGYYDEAQARAEAELLGAQGLDVAVYGVPAYSTLGWLEWLGGDPLLSTFIRYPEGELARIIFHELAHQVVYAQDDTAFNESFATAVERLGGERWLAQSTPQAREEYARYDERRRAIRAIVQEARRALGALYADAALDRDARLAGKQRELARLQQRYAALRERWGGWSGYDAYMARMNNAMLGAQAAYDDLVPGFEALFERSGRDFPRFYDAVRALARQPREQRHAALAVP